MRDRAAWQQQLLRTLKKVWPTGLDVDAERFVAVELGLALLEQVAPEEPAAAAWALLTGYPHGPTRRADWSADERRAAAVARHLLLPLKNRHDWIGALEGYGGVPADLRGFQVERGGDVPAVRKTVAILSNRWSAYADALGIAPGFQKDSLTVAAVGDYVFETRTGRKSVSIPSDLPLPPAPPTHDLTGKRCRPPLQVEWPALLETARWMDAEAERRRQTPSRWHARLARVRLDVLTGEPPAFMRADALTVDGLLHLVGMVSSGKSTLMDVLAVHAARNGFRAALVVGDVVGAIRRVNQFRGLGVAAAPVVGGSNRKRHIERLHRLLLADGAPTPLAHHDPGFDFLNTACVLDGLRSTARPLPLDDAPCQKLVPVAAADQEDTDDDDEAPRANGTGSRKRFGCPFYGGCQRHLGARELVEAQIWVATPASLVYSRVPSEINRERIRYLELVERTSDLVIVDEVDQVQVQLDAIFSPGQTLVGRQGNSWLDEVLALKDQALARGGRRQFAETSVAAWNTVADAARNAANRLYALVRQAPRVQRWIEQNYFTAWTLSDELLREWTGVERGADARENAAFQRLRRSFNAYLEDPLGDRGEGEDHPLAALSRAALPSANASTLRRALRAWLDDQTDVAVPTERLDEAVQKLEFVLLLAVLAERLNLLIRRWKLVETPLDLEGSSPMLFHRPPEDYAPVLPESPMGNVLGFQYRSDPDDPDQMGELRFFRCAGVGRWLLLNLHQLFAADGIAGPNVLLLSGTSWAGTSPSYHVQTPVGGVLRAPDEEVEAIARSSFAFTPLLDNDQQPLQVSGQRADRRINALSAMLVQLARRGRIPGAPSRLELERDRLPEGRQRILLLVGSYVEARQAYAALVQIREDWRGHVRHLVADDDEFDSGWDGEAATLRRGEVDKLADTEAWLLIAPLQAIERGHNILNEEGQAALGAAYFLVRPHPRPDDIGTAIHAINHWAVERCSHLLVGGSDVPLDKRARAFHAEAYVQWRRFLRLPMVYSTLPARERDALTWSQMVSIWQVIGRLVRGGCEARVYFCDAAFARQSALTQEGDTGSTSLLVNMRRVLRPYFEGENDVPCTDRELVRVLYGPFFDALARIQGVAEHAAL